MLKHNKNNTKWIKYDNTLDQRRLTEEGGGGRNVPLPGKLGGRPPIPLKKIGAQEESADIFLSLKGSFNYLGNFGFFSGHSCLWKVRLMPINRE